MQNTALQKSPFKPLHHSFFVSGKKIPRNWLIFFNSRKVLGCSSHWEKKWQSSESSWAIAHWENLPGIITWGGVGRGGGWGSAELKRSKMMWENNLFLKKERWEEKSCSLDEFWMPSFSSFQCHVINPWKRRFKASYLLDGLPFVLIIFTELQMLLALFS